MSVAEQTNMVSSHFVLVYQKNDKEMVWYTCASWGIFFCLIVQIWKQTFKYAEKGRYKYALHSDADYETEFRINNNTWNKYYIFFCPEHFSPDVFVFTYNIYNK